MDNSTNDHENLEKYSKEELIARIKALEAHNTQLKNIITKNQNSSKGHQLPKNKRSFNFDSCQFRHILLKFYYLGWDYQGYVVQEDTSNTIEHHLFEALIKTCLIQSRSLSNYHRCGRTDKGVSSFGQVISIKVRSQSPQDPTKELPYCKMLNRVLPDNIQCVAWCPVGDNFSARFDCQSRTYKYFFPKGNLHIDRMREAAGHLVGTHDFRNMCKMDVGNGVVEFIRNIISVKIYKISDQKEDPYAIYVLQIEGKAFLWHQIRCILGILFLVGQNKEQPEVVKELLDVGKNPRKPEYSMASEIPLNLYHCHYDGIEWIYDAEGIKIALKRLQEMWTLTQIKADMVKTMLTDLNCHAAADITTDDLNSCLLPGPKLKTYVPVMKRQLCESLEDRIEHYNRRGKLKKIQP